MGRSGYTDDDDGDGFAMWRGQVASAIRGKRGQAFLRDLAAALDAMSEKRLIAHELRVREIANPLLPWLFANCVHPEWIDLSVKYADSEDVFPRPDYYLLRWFKPSEPCGVCTIGALGEARGVSLERLDPEDHDTLGATFDIASPLVQEIEYLNDEAGFAHDTGADGRRRYRPETPEERWVRMRAWAASKIKERTPEPAAT